MTMALLPWPWGASAPRCSLLLTTSLLMLAGCSGPRQESKAQFRQRQDGSTPPPQPKPSATAPLFVVAAMVGVPTCPRTPQLLLAIYDNLALLRTGGACEKEQEPLRAVELSAEDRRQILQDVDLNPLLAGAQVRVEFCRGCQGRETDFVVLRTQQRFVRLVVTGAASDAEPEGTLTSAQRDGALAARGLARSLDRLREWLGRKPSQPWNSLFLVFHAVSSTRMPPESCRWPAEWPSPDGLGLLLQGQPPLTLGTDRIPAAAFTALRQRCPGTLLIRGVIGYVESFAFIPAQEELGAPLDTGSLR